MRHCWILLGLLIVSCWYQTPEPRFLTVAGALGEPLEDALRHDGIAFTEDGEVSRIALSDREGLLRALARVDQAYNQARELHHHNLANLRPTRLPLFGPDGALAGATENWAGSCWVYDPAHPEAVKDGPQAGYVAQSNVNEAYEERALGRLRAQQSVVQEVMRRVEPEVVISPIVEANDPNGSPNQFLEFTVTDSPRFQKPGKKFDLHWAEKTSDPVKVGQSSVANALNWLSGSAKYTAATIENRHGFGLLQALKEESKPFALDWRDVGDLSEKTWPAIVETLKQGYPVLVAFNGELAPSSAGHIVVLLDTQDGNVEMYDPWRGKPMTQSVASLLEAPAHPDGNFVFLPYSAPGP